MTTFFVRLSLYFRKHRAVCWSSMLALFVFFGYFATQIHLEEDINKLMPSSKNEDGTTKLAFADLKIKDKVFLLFEGEGAENLIEACDAFVDTLLLCDSVSQTINDVFYRLPEDLVVDGVDYLSSYFPAYIDTSAYVRFDTLLTREHFVRQMQQNRRIFAAFRNRNDDRERTDAVFRLKRKQNPLLQDFSGVGIREFARFRKNLAPYPFRRGRGVTVRIFFQCRPHFRTTFFPEFGCDLCAAVRFPDRQQVTLCKNFLQHGSLLSFWLNFCESHIRSNQNFFSYPGNKKSL